MLVQRPRIPVQSWMTKCMTHFQGIPCLCLQTICLQNLKVCEPTFVLWLLLWCAFLPHIGTEHLLKTFPGLESFLDGEITEVASSCYTDTGDRQELRRSGHLLLFGHVATSIFGDQYTGIAWLTHLTELICGHKHCSIVCSIIICYLVSGPNHPPRCS